LVLAAEEVSQYVADDYDCVVTDLGSVRKTSFEVVSDWPVAIEKSYREVETGLAVYGIKGRFAPAAKLGTKVDQPKEGQVLLGASLSRNENKALNDFVEPVYWTSATVVETGRITWGMGGPDSHMMPQTMTLISRSDSRGCRPTLYFDQQGKLVGCWTGGAENFRLTTNTPGIWAFTAYHTNVSEAVVRDARE
ncbi:MAG: hypothetical protein KDA92_15555, partial [Planctomycetales bacterium]|nr:hypothetical protein [Planctomycetales bacterium]